MCGVTNNEICDVLKFEDLSSIMANVDVTLRALFVKVPLKLWGNSLTELVVPLCPWETFHTCVQQ